MRRLALLGAGLFVWGASVFAQGIAPPVKEPTPVSAQRGNPGEINPFASEKSQRILEMLSGRSADREQAQRDRSATALDDAADRIDHLAPREAFEEHLKNIRDDPGAYNKPPAGVNPPPGGESSSGGGSSPGKQTSNEEKNKGGSGPAAPSGELTGSEQVVYCNIDLKATVTVEIAGGSFRLDADGKSNRDCPQSNRSCCFSPPVEVRAAISGSFRGDEKGGTLSGECRDTVRDESGESRFRRNVSGTLRNGVLFLQIDADRQGLLDPMKWAIRVE